VGGVDRGNEAGARRGSGTCQGGDTEWWRPEPGPIEEAVWRVSLHPFGCLLPFFLFLRQSSSSSRRDLDPAAMGSIWMVGELDSVEGKLDPRAMRSNREVTRK